MEIEERVGKRPANEIGVTAAYSLSETVKGLYCITDWTRESLLFIVLILIWPYSARLRTQLISIASGN